LKIEILLPPRAQSFSLCALLRRLSRCCLSQLLSKLRDEDGLLSVRTGGDHADSRSRLVFEEAQIVLCLLGQPGEVGDALRGFLPPGHSLVHGSSFSKAGG